MTAAPSGWLTSSGLDGLETALNDYDWGEVRTQHIAALFTMARAALPAQAALETATDLPLSVAMRMARQRTEKGEETWIACFQAATGATWLIKHVGIWVWTASSLVSWGNMPSLSADSIESTTCRLVSPADGEAILRGGE